MDMPPQGLQTVVGLDDESLPIKPLGSEPKSQKGSYGSSLTRATTAVIQNQRSIRNTQERSTQNHCIQIQNEEDDYPR